MNLSNNTITQLHGVTPEQFKESIIHDMEKVLGDFKKEIETKTKESYLTRQETSKMLSITLPSLNNWSKKGILRPLRMGNRIYYKLSDIENKLNGSNESK